MRSKVKGLFAMVGACIHFDGYSGWASQPEVLRNTDYFGMLFDHFVKTFGIIREEASDHAAMSTKIRGVFEEMLGEMTPDVREKVLAAKSGRFLPAEAKKIPAIVAVSFASLYE
jgi:hypothetical protein